MVPRGRSLGRLWSIAARETPRMVHGLINCRDILVRLLSHPVQGRYLPFSAAVIATRLHV
jgi:hypothetical protein